VAEAEDVVVDTAGDVQYAVQEDHALVKFSEGI
jgi:hypothetical protein